MTLSKITSTLGIENYPDSLEEIFNDKSIDFSSPDFLDTEYLKSLHQKYDIFGEYEKIVLDTTRKMQNDTAFVIFGNLGKAYLDAIGDDTPKAKKFPMPKSSSNQTFVDLFPIILICTQLEKARERYSTLGATNEEIYLCMKAFGSCFKEQSRRFGKPVLPAANFPWLCNYMCANILSIHGFNFEIIPFEFNGVYVKNKETGKLTALMLNEKMHRDGYVLGTPGYLDDKDSFFASFEETPDAFIGYAVNKAGTVPNIKQTFPKSEWSLCMKKDDMIISFHIPKNADFTKENLDSAFEIGAKKMRHYFSQYDIKGVMCASWLVSPQLKDILKPDSKIVSFGERFTPLPQINSGMSVFTNVFPAGITRLEDLPENTSLERALKKLYLDGKYLYTYPGFFEI